MSESKRIEGVDVLRGIVMVLMALDHTRDFWGDVRLRPEDLERTTPALFATRWVTHFCAPVFVFLAGISAYLHGRKLDSKWALSRFLFTRGLWLVVLEFTVVGFSWQLSLTSGLWILQVIAAIGIGMIALAGLIHLPHRIVLGVGLLIVLGHSLLDHLTLDPGGPAEALRSLVHDLRGYNLGSQYLWMQYQPLAWVGVITVGYGFGPVLAWPRPIRRRVCLIVGASATLAFVLLRLGNLYGEPMAWEGQDTAAMSVVSFLNCTKYPPSLHFLLMTLGPALMALALLDREPGPIARHLRTFGRVPLFYYVGHVFLLSVSAMLFAWVVYGAPFNFITDSLSFPAGYGNGLFVVYFVWLLAVVLLYLPCAWYEGVKRRSRSWVFSYL